MGNINSFKGRTLDPTKPMKVYRNLNRKGKWYSIQQNGLVVGHTQDVSLKNCKFIVGESGKKRALRTQQRNVHAFIYGYLDDKGDDLGAYIDYTRVRYEPFNELGFFYKSNNKTIEINHSVYCKVDETGVHCRCIS